ncbi:hypothetical protein [Bradyrhizobium semiaridum]|uniref:hypothetical protein n=1 Tax=Bradyrhizobium semiaridum TaxID=2821404 RepID=UPI00201BA69F|nr:hypothetical protein [Bradyrhizobium semiaridum]
MSLSAPFARAQTAAPAPSPEALAVAKEFVTTMHLVDQFKALMPSIMNSLKPAIVQGRNNVEQDYDALIPALLNGFQARFSELSRGHRHRLRQQLHPGRFARPDHLLQEPGRQKLLEKTPAVT